MKPQPTISKKWKRHNNGDLTWQDYEIRTEARRRTWGVINVYWAYTPDGVCLIPGAEDLANAKKACHQHFETKIVP